jgi:hypothetical protein
MMPPRDVIFAVSRRIETLIAEISLCENRPNLWLLEQRANELLTELPPGITRARLEERLQDAIGERYQELRFQEL